MKIESLKEFEVDPIVAIKLVGGVPKTWVHTSAVTQQMLNCRDTREDYVSDDGKEKHSMTIKGPCVFERKDSTIAGRGIFELDPRSTWDREIWNDNPDWNDSEIKNPFPLFYDPLPISSLIVNPFDTNCSC